VADPAVGALRYTGVQLAKRAAPLVVSNDLDTRPAPASHTGGASALLGHASA